jgi:serine phosphatase RsbU (regulator of sigma subunit)
MAAGAGLDTSGDPEGAVRRAVAMAGDGLSGPPSLCIALADNVHTSPRRVLAALHETLGKNCQVFGGFAASEGDAADTVYQFHGPDVHAGAVALLLFAGPVEATFVISNSWRPLGTRALVEGSKGRSVSRIGGKSALQFFHDTFGPHPEPVPEMPLAVYDNTEHYYIRAAEAFNAADGSVRFYSHVPHGALVQFTEATPEGILANTADTLSRLVSGLESSWVPQAALIFSCAARKWILGLQVDEEAALIQRHLPAGTPFAGFYSYGEIAPTAPGLPPRYHNCTMITLLIGEKDFCTRPAMPAESAAPSPADRDPDRHNKDRYIALLEHRLARARHFQGRLEYHKSLSGRMLRRMNQDLAAAKRKIEQQHRILKESLTLAQQVQQRLLPRERPRFPGFDIAGRSLYCDETGGDYFDYLVQPEAEGGFSIVVGDVSGHGVAAALLMTTARALLRMRASKAGTPSEFVSDLNRFLASDVQDTGQFMTLFYLRLDSAGSAMTWVRAGHDPALRYAPARNDFEEMRGEGLALGVLDDWRYREYHADAAAEGDIIVIGTDGIWEARDARNQLFGKERFMEVIRASCGKTADEIVAACFQAVREFRGGLPIEDDITLVVIKKT